MFMPEVKFLTPMEHHFIPMQSSLDSVLLLPYRSNVRYIIITFITLSRASTTMKQVATMAASLMAASARTAHKVGGKDSLEIVVVMEDADLKRIAQAMKDRAPKSTNEAFGLRDADNIEHSEPLLLVGLNEFQAGLLWGAQVLATIVSKPLLGRLSDHYGFKPAIAFGMLAWAVAFAAIPLLTRFELLILASLLFGLGEAFMTSSSAALVADLCKERHFGTGMGTFGTISDVGHASGPILAGFLIARWGCLPAFSILSFVLLLAIPVFILGVNVEPESQTAPTASQP
jgi:uncharacterized ferredoxin-like protein